MEVGSRQLGRDLVAVVSYDTTGSCLQPERYPAFPGGHAVENYR